MASRAQVSAPVRAIVSLYPLFLAATVLGYAAAVIVALPLGVTGIVKVEWCVVPLAIGGLTLPFTLVGERYRSY